MKRFQIDDYVLLFAVVVLSSITTLHLVILPYYYDLLAVILHGTDPILLSNVINKHVITLQESMAISTLWWFVMFPVKLAFLIFFRRLLDRVRDLRIWWYCVVTFTVLSGFVSVAMIWVTCPFVNAEGLRSRQFQTTAAVADREFQLACSDEAALYRNFRGASIATALDIASDICIISIPVVVLWRIQLELRHKMGIGVSLCLSSVLIAVAITRMAGFKLADGAVDVVWLAFWQQQECSLAVIVVSASAFRMFFVAGSSHNSPQKNVLASWHGRRKLVPRQWGLSTDEEMPDIPGTTLTGVRTFIGGVGTQANVWADGSQRGDELRIEP